ncbi:BrnA antitoxin family protein [Leptospira bandrabouensis]|uniref:BrnA antitoxin family protein n=1 Tax=Leptospira bandrabouensis TaxID=2484903 RepID=UPI001EE8AE5B|nr:BrnA antitoxin family protein [Leptospira bandrabouensis]MCG6146548.1 BrnA antitoxin family protein [Leptospira bandrabouensis]MCG6161921.1 BrnA antitoxin family protein [Leptospira bandrabouensis]MCG6166114.1 BrnA antitoxin family protein [Leptospira bandrabouensis]
MKTIKKKIPKFKSTDEEIEFWDKNDATDFFNFQNLEKISFPNLKPSTKMISLRLPEALLERLKTLANKNDVPYQSLIKILLSEKVNEEFKKVS